MTGLCEIDETNSLKDNEMLKERKKEREREREKDR